MSQYEFFSAIKDRYSPSELVDVLELTTDDLIEYLHECILESAYKFRDDMPEFFFPEEEGLDGI